MIRGNKKAIFLCKYNENIYICFNVTRLFFAWFSICCVDRYHFLKIIVRFCSFLTVFSPFLFTNFKWTPFKNVLRCWNLRYKIWRVVNWNLCHYSVICILTTSKHIKYIQERVLSWHVVVFIYTISNTTLFNGFMKTKLTS